MTVRDAAFPDAVAIRSSSVKVPPFTSGTTVFGVAGFGIGLPFSRKSEICTPPKHCGGVLAATQVHCELAGIRSAVSVLPLNVNDRVWTIACDRLWSNAACVVTSKSAVVKVPPNKLPDGNENVRKPPFAANSPVSFSKPTAPSLVPVTEIAPRYPARHSTATAG